MACSDHCCCSPKTIIRTIAFAHRERPSIVPSVEWRFEAGNALPRDYRCSIQLVPAGVCAAVLSLDHLDAIRLAEIDKIVPFLPPGARAFSTWERGRQTGAGTPAPRFRRRRDRDRRLELCHAARLPRHGLRRPDDPAGRCQYRRRFLVKCAGARAGSVPYAWRNTPRAGARRHLSSRSSNSYVAALDHAGIVPRGDLVFRFLPAAASSASSAERSRTAAIAAGLVPDRPSHDRPLASPTAR